MVRNVAKAVKGSRTIDGAGVNLVRVLGNETARDYDPFLMLDSFDSTNPDDYLAGFPFHPHRGIETITYLIEGEMAHEDSIGNSGVIRAGEVQWMTAGRGILHQEMPKASPRMLGVQIWLNLAARDKMTAPAYFDIKREMIGEKEEPFGRVRVLSGTFDGISGVQAPYHAARLLDLTVEAGKTAVIPSDAKNNVFIFAILGACRVGGKVFDEKTAVLFGEGDAIEVSATDKPCRILYFEGEKLQEPIAWGGPIVMNTRAELNEAFAQLRAGTFTE
jgi:redox-sensitive bicupin YhaK (pirin superfamily)